MGKSIVQSAALSIASKEFRDVTPCECVVCCILELSSSAHGVVSDSVAACDSSFLVINKIYTHTLLGKLNLFEALPLCSSRLGFTFVVEPVTELCVKMTFTA